MDVVVLGCFRACLCRTIAKLIRTPRVAFKVCREREREKGINSYTCDALSMHNNGKFESRRDLAAFWRVETGGAVWRGYLVQLLFRAQAKEDVFVDRVYSCAFLSFFRCVRARCQGFSPGRCKVSVPSETPRSGLKVAKEQKRMGLAGVLSLIELSCPVMSCVRRKELGCVYVVCGYFGAPVAFGA